MNIAKSTTNLKRLLTYILFFGPLLGCHQTSVISQPTEEQLNTAKNSTPLESIYEVQIKEKSIWFTVKSNGCTQKEDFNLHITPSKNGSLEAKLVRPKPDYCRAKSRLVVIDMPHELVAENAESIKVLNPVAAKFDSHFKGNKKTTK